MQTNKYIVLFLFFSVTFIACKTKIPQTNLETIKFDDKNDTNNEDKSNENYQEDTSIAVIDTVVIIDTIVEIPLELKDQYNIAILLPFMEDSVRNLWNDAKKENFEDFVFKDESEIATSFYEGFILALYDLEFNSKFNITVYDTQNSIESTKNAIQKMKEATDSIDIIIGPYSRSNVVEVSEYAKLNKIVHISPFSPSKSASLGNSKYYMIEPSLEQHILNMLDYGIDSIENPHFKFVYHNSTSGKSYAQLVQNYIDKINEERELFNQINYSLITIDEDLEIKDHLNEDINNVLIINSFEEDFLHVVLSQIAAIKKEYKATIFGMPGWENSKIIRLSYLNSANIHFTNTTWIDLENNNTKLFNKAYKTKYKAKASEQASLGYDIAAIFLKTIDEIGLNLNEKILNYEFDGISRKFSFKEVVSSDNKIHRIENTDLRIYKIENYEKVLVK